MAKILETEDVGTCRKKLTVQIPPEEMDKELDGVYEEFLRTADVPGFRRGHAPRYILQMRYGRILEKEAIRKAVEEAFRKATEEAGLKSVTEPQFQGLDKIEYKQNEPITFAAEFECIPDFELADYSDIQPKVEELQITEKEVVETLDRIRENSAYFSSVDRPVQEGDFVLCSVDATIEGEPFKEATHPEIFIQIGSKQYIPGLEDGLIGAAAGECRELDLILPDDYPVEERRGKQAHFSVTVKEIRVRHLPELDDEFAKDVGDFQTISELKDGIRRTLEENLERRREREQRESIRRQLLEKNVFDPPPSMVNARAQYVRALQDIDLRRMGSSLDELLKEDKEAANRIQTRAEEETRLSLILDRIAKQEKIEVSDEEYRQFVTNLAERENLDVAWYMRRIAEYQMEIYYRRLALEEKVITFLLLPPEERAKEAEKPPELQEEQVAAESKEVRDNGTDTDGGGAD